MLSEYAETLDDNVKKRYVEKVSEVGADPVLDPRSQVGSTIIY